MNRRSFLARAISVPVVGLAAIPLATAAPVAASTAAAGHVIVLHYNNQAMLAELKEAVPLILAAPKSVKDRLERIYNRGASAFIAYERDPAFTATKHRIGIKARLHGEFADIVAALRAERDRRVCAGV